MEFLIELIFSLFSNWSAATAGRIAPGQAGVDAKEIAPAGEFVESTLLVALADVALDFSPVSNEVIIVVILMVEADAEAVVIKVLHGNRLVARQEVRVAYARAVGIERPHVPRLAVVPDGKGFARKVAYPCAYQGLGVCRIRRRVIDVVGACGEAQYHDGHRHQKGNLFHIFVS